MSRVGVVRAAGVRAAVVRRTVAVGFVVAALLATSAAFGAGRAVAAPAPSTTTLTSTAAPIGSAITLTSVSTRPGRVRFTVDGVEIPGCESVATALRLARQRANCSFVQDVADGHTFGATLTPTASSAYASSSATLTVRPRLVAPGGVSVAPIPAGSRATDVAFAPPPGVAPPGYQVRCVSTAGAVTRIGFGTQSPVHVDPLDAGLTFACSVRAEYGGTLAGPYSGTASVTVPIELPDTPADVYANPTDTAKALISVNPETNAFGPPASYNVRCVSTNGGRTRNVTVKRMPYLMTLLTVGTRYSCQVQAVNAAGASAWSAPSPAFVAPGFGFPATPPTTTPPPPPPARSGPDGIASDCSVDVTAALNDWIAAAPAGATLDLATNGCYRVDDTVLLVNRRDLTLEGNGATFQAVTTGDIARRHVWIQGGSHVTVHNLVVRGANPDGGAHVGGFSGSQAFQHGFALKGVDGVTLDHVEVYDVFGDFVYVGGTSTAPSRNVLVTGSRFERSGRQGISVVDGVGVTIERSYVADAGLSLFDLEPLQTDDLVVDVKILGNTTGAARHFWLADKGAGANVQNIVVDGNTAVEPTGGLVFVYGPVSGYRGPFQFTNNVLFTTDRAFDEGSKGAFFLSRAWKVLIANNVVTVPPGSAMPAVESRDSIDVTIVGNTWRNTGVELLLSSRAPTTTTTTAPPPSTTTAPSPSTTTGPSTTTTAPPPPSTTTGPATTTTTEPPPTSTTTTTTTGSSEPPPT